MYQLISLVDMPFECVLGYQKKMKKYSKNEALFIENKNGYYSNIEKIIAFDYFEMYYITESVNHSEIIGDAVIVRLPDKTTSRGIINFSSVLKDNEETKKMEIFNLVLNKAKDMGIEEVEVYINQNDKFTYFLEEEKNLSDEQLKCYVLKISNNK